MSATRAAVADRAPAAAWLVCGLGAVFFGYGFFLRVSPSVMVDDLMRDFAVGGAVLGNLSAVYFYAYAGLQIPVGLMVDRWGPRRVMTVAALVCGSGSLLFASVNHLAPAYLGRLLIGGGAAFAFVSTLTLITRWFPLRRFALLSGLTMLLGMSGAFAGQAPLAALVAVVGWRTTLLWAAVAGLVLAALIWLMVRDHPGGVAAAPAEPAEPAASGVLAALRVVAARPQSWVLALYALAMSAPLLAFAGLWGVPYLMERYDLSRPAAAFTTSLMLVGWAVGAPVTGWLSDRVRRRKAPMVIGALVALVAMAAMLYLPGLPILGFQALILLSGVAASSMVISYGTAREHNPGRAVGTAYGFVNTASTAAGALFQPLVGWLLDLNWDGRMVAGARVYSSAAYDRALLVLPLCFLIGVIAALMTRETGCRPVAPS